MKLAINRTTLVNLLLGSVLLIVTVLPVRAADGPVWSGVERIVTIGDIHGDYSQYIEALERNGLIDHRLRWSGGETHLVQLGDVPDRGPDTRKIMEHLQKLERQAKRAGGYVHTLIGNHEAMNIYGDLRYVHPGEYAAMTMRHSERRQRDYIERVQAFLEETRPEADRSLETLKAQYPLGYVEHRVAWAPNGELGKWVLDNNAVIKINDVLFVHGGLSPHQPPMTLSEINEAVREALSGGEQVVGENITNSPNGPLWYRGLATAPSADEMEPLKVMLEFYDANHIVVGHTPTSGEIRVRFGGRVILSDVGMAAHYGAHDANLVIEGDAFYAIDGDGQHQLDID